MIYRDCHPIDFTWSNKGSSELYLFIHAAFFYIYFFNPCIFFSGCCISGIFYLYPALLCEANKGQSFKEPGFFCNPGNIPWFFQTQHNTHLFRLVVGGRGTHGWFFFYIIICVVRLVRAAL